MAAAKALDSLAALCQRADGMSGIQNHFPITPATPKTGRRVTRHAHLY